MGKFRQYITKHGQLRTGAKHCTLCGQSMAKTQVCDCSIKVRLSGRSGTLETVLAELGRVLQFQIPDDPFIDPRTNEECLVIYATNPEYMDGDLPRRKRSVISDGGG